MKKTFDVANHNKLLSLCDQDSAMGFEDMLIFPERNEESVWKVKHDLLVSEISPSVVDVEATGCRHPSDCEGLHETSYLHDLTVKEESADASSSSTRNIVLDDLSCSRPLDCDIADDGLLTERLRNLTENGTQELTALWNIASAVPSHLEDATYHSSENDTPATSWYSSASTRTQGIRRVDGFFPEMVRKGVTNDCRFHKEVQKPPTTAGIGLGDLKAVFHLDRPKAEKQLRLKRTTFSNLNRHFGISKWPFRTIRDALNRMKANQDTLLRANLSGDRERKLIEQQKLLAGVIKLIYAKPSESRDSNTLAVLLQIVASRGTSASCQPL